jgi:flagellar biosynthesis/type III secretory pathway ATPase
MLDEAIKLQPAIETFLQQDISERADVQESHTGLSALFQ